MYQHYKNNSVLQGAEDLMTLFHFFSRRRHKQNYKRETTERLLINYDSLNIYSPHTITRFLCFSAAKSWLAGCSLRKSVN
jgi:hypothetical protein